VAEECYVCKRTQKEMDVMFKDVLVPFRKKATDLMKNEEAIIKEWNSKFKKFTKTHEGKDYLDLTFQTIYTDRDQFSKMIENLDEFIDYAHWKDQKISKKEKLGDVLEYINNKKFWDINLKHKYHKDDPRKALRSMKEERTGWEDLVKKFEISTYHMKKFRSHHFSFLDTDRKEEMMEYLLDKEFKVPICPVCLDMITS
jgi:hypothetical protein